MKKFKIISLAIWLVSFCLLNASMVSASTNCSVSCCDSSALNGAQTCANTSQFCRNNANRVTGDFTKDCGLDVNSFGQPDNNGSCKNGQTPICCCANTTPTPDNVPPSKPSLVNDAALTPLNFMPQVSIPNSDFQAGKSTVVGTPVSTNEGTAMSSNLLGRYVLAMYNYGLDIVGILAAIIMMAGGVLWLTSAGNTSKISQAKELMTGSVIGLLILVGAWFLLNTINPNLTQLPTITTLVINEIPYCCDAVKGNIEAVKGVCPGNSQGCASGETCSNSGQVVANSDGNEGASSNTFSCVNTSAKICCGYHVQAGNDDRDICFTFTGDACQTIPDLKPYQANASPAVITAKGTSAVSFVRHEDCGNGKLVAHGATCAAGIVDCSDAKDGDKCPTKDGSTKGWCYCYNKAPWYGDGTIGEPCGKKSGSSCMTTCSQGYNHAWGTGGRDCLSGVNCCQPN